MGSFLLSFLKHSENSVVRFTSERGEEARVGKSASGLPTGLASGVAPVLPAPLSSSALRPLLDGYNNKCITYKSPLTTPLACVAALTLSIAQPLRARRGSLGTCLSW